VLPDFCLFQYNANSPINEVTYKVETKLKSQNDINVLIQ